MHTPSKPGCTIKPKGVLNREISDTEIRVMFVRCFWSEIFPDPLIHRGLEA